MIIDWLLLLAVVIVQGVILRFAWKTYRRVEDVWQTIVGAEVTAEVTVEPEDPLAPQ